MRVSMVFRLLLVSAGVLLCTEATYGQSPSVDRYREDCRNRERSGCHNFGMIYYDGMYGVERDYARAARLFRQDCEIEFELGVSSMPLSCLRLGSMYLEGKGVLQDYEQAFSIFSSICSDDTTFGCLALAERYENGEGVSENFVIAHALYNIEGADGDRRARQARAGVESRMSSAEVAEAQALARVCMEQGISACLDE